MISNPSTVEQFFLCGKCSRQLCVRSRRPFHRWSLLKMKIQWNALIKASCVSHYLLNEDSLNVHHSQYNCAEIYRHFYAKCMKAFCVSYNAFWLLQDAETRVLSMNCASIIVATLLKRFIIDDYKSTHNGAIYALDGIIHVQWFTRVWTQAHSQGEYFNFVPLEMTLNVNLLFKNCFLWCFSLQKYARHFLLNILKQFLRSDS